MVEVKGVAAVPEGQSRPTISCTRHPSHARTSQRPESLRSRSCCSPPNQRTNMVEEEREREPAPTYSDRYYDDTHEYRCGASRPYGQLWRASVLATQLTTGTRTQARRPAAGAGRHAAQGQAPAERGAPWALVVDAQQSASSGGLLGVRSSAAQLHASGALRKHQADRL